MIEIVVILGLLFLLAFAITVMIPRTELDVSRQRLFEIRDELFDQMRRYELLDSRVHRKERETINGVIRFAHHISADFLVVMALAKTPQLDHHFEKEMAELEAEIERLPAGARAAIKRARSDVLGVIAEMLIGRSFLLTAVRFLHPWVSRIRLPVIVRLRNRLGNFLRSRSKAAVREAYIEGLQGIA